MGSARTLFVVNDARYFLSHRLALARAVRATGSEVHVATYRDEFSAVIEQEGFLYHEIPLKRHGKQIFYELYSLYALAVLYLKLRPALVFHVTLKPVLYGGIAARLASIPAVINVLPGLGHVFVDEGHMTSLMRHTVLFACRFALGHSNARTVFQNPDDQMIFTKQGIVDEQLTRVIRGSGVDMSQFVHLPEMPGIPLVILCARMLWSKGVRIFVEAARALRDTGVKARFALIGDTDIGNPAAIARFELEAWRDEGVVEWWGHCDGMPEIFKQCHIVCLPSAYGEGVPKVLIEAAASGRAIVATAIPGCGEIVRDGVNGLLVPVHDSVRLADALQRLIENPQLRRQMGAQGRAMAEAEFSIEKVVGETLEIYNQLLSRNPH